MIALFFFSACSPSHKQEVDELNSLSYAYHYRNLDSTQVFAQRAMKLADDYPAGYAEAHNNMAFVAIAKMQYQHARSHLDEVERRSDNQIEILIAHIQNMRLCQRESRNKDFYAYREKAMRLLNRIGEEADNLPDRERRRALYARSEFDIVAATYFYYVRQEEPMLQALNDIDADALEADTAQYLNYLYNIGSGGAVVNGTAEEIAQTEFDYLMRCFMLACSGPTYPYWQANALQALSEHLQDESLRRYLIRNNQPYIKYINVDQVPDSLLAGNLAQMSLNLFTSYGDVYQIAGAHRTLAECYWAIGDYLSAESCLQHALNDHPAILAAPDLVASISERLCLVYSAMDDKQHSDYYRNQYLDLQERTRQDRQLEARAALLDNNAVLLNWMIAAVIGMIVIVVFLLYLFDRMRRRSVRRESMTSLLEPLQEWRRSKEQTLRELKEQKEELDEDLQMTLLHVKENKKRHLEQRAKVSLVQSITPFIDRMIHEVNQLQRGSDSEEVKQERYQYIAELTDKIHQYNQVLTQWIQMRQGTLSLRINSFSLQSLFDIVQKGKMNFDLKGVQLIVQPTEAVVKADRTLTVFMINTMADNARKFTPSGGQVVIQATCGNDYVEISITDTGEGMDQQQLEHIFDRTYTGGHGFGLLNCKGIIEKYKKISSIFSVCTITAESRLGQGSRFSFRLPKGIGHLKTLLVILVSVFTMLGVSVPMEATPVFPTAAVAPVKAAPHHQHEHDGVGRSFQASLNLQRADVFADSAYYANIRGDYERTLQFADSSRSYLNKHYLSVHPRGRILMTASPSDVMPAELLWYKDSFPTNYYVILDIRNESAVAALALHKWALYQSNNTVYTKLYREMGADSMLPAYVRTMQVSENSKTVAIVLLILLLLQLPLAYYLLYYRHVLSYRFAVEKVNDINRVLLSDGTDEEKLRRIRQIWQQRGVRLQGLSAQLGDLVKQIEEALLVSMQRTASEFADMEITRDEINKAEYENARLHISCSVLDNCLSTLKHETMYYPSRIRQLIENDPEDVQSLHELVDYYKSLYTLLSAQAMEQVEYNVKNDKFLRQYLFDLLTAGVGKVEVRVEDLKDSSYAVCWVEMLEVAYDEQLHHQLFTPLTHDMKYLLCRQIVREIGEVTYLRGCGISAKSSASGKLMIEIVLPTKLAHEEEFRRNVSVK